jgi:hypothetical protein
VALPPDKSKVKPVVKLFIGNDITTKLASFGVPQRLAGIFSHVFHLLCWHSIKYGSANNGKALMVMPVSAYSLPCTWSCLLPQPLMAIRDHPHIPFFATIEAMCNILP